MNTLNVPFIVDLKLQEVNCPISWIFHEFPVAHLLQPQQHCKMSSLRCFLPSRCRHRRLLVSTPSQQNWPPCHWRKPSRNGPLHLATGEVNKQPISMLLHYFWLLDSLCGIFNWMHKKQKVKNMFVLNNYLLFSVLWLTTPTAEKYMQCKLRCIVNCLFSPLCSHDILIGRLPLRTPRNLMSVPSSTQQSSRGCMKTGGSRCLDPGFGGDTELQYN